MKIDDFHASVLYVRQYPTWMTDRMIKTLTDIGIELAITVHANPYDPGQFTQKLLTAQSQVKVEMIKNQREGAQAGILILNWQYQEWPRKPTKPPNVGRKRPWKMIEGIFWGYRSLYHGR